VYKAGDMLYAVMIILADPYGDASTITGFYEHNARKLPQVGDEIEARNTLTGRTIRVRVARANRNDAWPIVGNEIPLSEWK
jgi:hypothetical protein